MTAFKTLFFLLVFVTFAAGSDFPFIPSGETGVFVRFESKDAVPDGGDSYISEKDAIYYKEPVNNLGDIYSAGLYDKKENVNETAGLYFAGRGGGYEDIRPASVPAFFIRTAAGYYSVSVNPGISGAAAGGIAAGLSVGLDRFAETGLIDLGTSARAASLMAGSSYLGVNAGSYAADFLFKPVLSGGVIQGALSSAAGGAASGALFAAGAFATGYADRHEMRTIAVKSAVGSSASAGVTAVFGAGAGAASAGGLILPYIAAAGAVYFVEKMFEAFDKQEEKERVERLLLEFAQ